MFTVDLLRKDDSNFVALQNSKNTSKALLSLEEGGRLLSLKLEEKKIIKEIPTFDYKVSYASSILFPFASRIKNGSYKFKEKSYQFDCNDSTNNALHGLIFNKTFKIIEKVESVNYASVTISYTETQKSVGFPYTYHVELKYTLYKNDISLMVKITNTDQNQFPFTLGWHPYFYSTDLSKSFLKFNTDKQIIFDENLITKNIVNFKVEKEFTLKNRQLDDCFILNSDTIEFITPDYEIEISSNQLENYLQLYTPKDFPVIAVEPMTGVSDSFNNKIGLQILEPNETHSLKWNIKLNA